VEELLIVGRKEGGNGEIKASRSHCEPLQRDQFCVYLVMRWCLFIISLLIHIVG
jgi:hypothetical protein